MLFLLCDIDVFPTSSRILPFAGFILLLFVRTANRTLKSMADKTQLWKDAKYFSPFILSSFLCLFRAGRADFFLFLCSLRIPYLLLFFSLFSSLQSYLFTAFYDFLLFWPKSNLTPSF